MKRTLCLVSCLVPVSGGAFFDHFNGTELGDWWLYSGLGWWEYNVSGGALHVTKVYGEYFDTAGVSAWIGYFYTISNNFELIAWVGWDPGEYQQLEVSLGPDWGGFSTVGMHYVNIPGSPPYVQLRSDSSKLGKKVPVPNFGMHEFRIKFIGGYAYDYFDGRLIDSAKLQNYGFLDWVTLYFSSSDKWSFAPLRVSFVGIHRLPE